MTKRTTMKHRTAMSITDEQLTERANYLAVSNTPNGKDWAQRLTATFEATRAALEVDRESLRLLEKLHNVCDNAGHERNEYHEAGNCPIEDAIEAHITTLRKRLGVEP